MANVLGELFSDIAGAIRDLTGESSSVKRKPTEFAGKIREVAENGGGSADFCYVTFMNHDGTVTYGKKAVAKGDDCADPIVRDVFSTPTRESDAQYNYTFAGWSTEVNGGLSSDALKLISENRTVYANFAAVLRSYTVSFYDDDIHLKSMTLTYGTMPYYIPTKEGYDLLGWEPELTTVTGEATYVAKWTEKITFATASWERISELAAAGEAQTYFSVGDTKQVPYGASGDTVTITIAGFNHDTLTDGNKAPISFICMTPQTTMPYNTSFHSGLNYHYGMANCKPRSEGLPAIKQQLPSDLRKVIHNVSKTYHDWYNSSATTKEIEDDLWIPSIAELGYTGTNNKYGGDGEKYALFSENTELGGFPTCTFGGNKVAYWTRSLFRIGVWSPVYIKSTGYVSYTQGTNMPNDSAYICFGFCI